MRFLDWNIIFYIFELENTLWNIDEKDVAKLLEFFRRLIYKVSATGFEMRALVKVRSWIPIKNPYYNN